MRTAPSPSLPRLGASLLALGFAGTLLVACGDDATTANDTTDVDRPLVVATTTQLADFARVVGGDDVEVYSVLRPNLDAHDFEVSPKDLDALTRADVIVANGLEFEPWLDDAVEASGTDVEVIDTSEGADLLEGGHDQEDEAHSDEEDKAHDDDEEAHRDDDNAHDEDGHDHDGEWNPHLWFDPANAEVMVGHATDAIVEAAPDAADAIRERSDAYIAELRELDEWIEAELEPLENRYLVTDHDAFPYYIDRYDLIFIGSVIPSFDSSAEVSAADLNELASAIEDKGVTAIFTEQALPPRAAETVARQAGVQVASGEDGLYGDSLGPEGSSGETYLSMMRHNTTTIAENLS